MNPAKRPLTGLTVGLSISESNDSSDRGFPAWQVNRVTLQVVSTLFGQGAGVVFGHDWREDGVMQAVHGFALPMQPVFSESNAAPLLRNCLPWPDQPHLPTDEIARLSETLAIECVPLPAGLQRYEKDAKQQGPAGPLYKYLRARGLTALRHRLNAICDARLCLGGRQSGASGRYPGVIEEILFALRSNKPLYLSGLLGGATRQVIAALEGAAMPDDFCPRQSLNELYEQPLIADGITADREINRHALWTEFNQAGFTQIARDNGLSEDENRELAQTLVLDRVLQLMLQGLSRLQRL